MFTYNIDENNSIRIYEEGNNIPIIFQPFWPAGQAWGSFEEADSWAKLQVANFNGEKTDFYPGISPEEPVIPKSAII